MDAFLSKDVSRFVAQAERLNHCLLRNVDTFINEDVSRYVVQAE